VTRFFRAAGRFLLSLLLFLRAYLDFVFRLRLRGRAGSLNARAEWLRLWSGRLLRILHVEVAWEGTPPAPGLMVSNHLSYLDVLVYGSICPLIFVSKHEVRSWPVAGPLTRCAGTLYLRRQSRSDLARLGVEMKPVVDAGLVAVLFLEGTSTDGTYVLPFRSSLLAGAIEHGWPVTPSCIGYSMAEGSPERDVCYWGDMTFLPHFLNLLSRPSVLARVRFGAPESNRLSRKDLAHVLHIRVCSMKASSDPAPSPA